VQASPVAARVRELRWRTLPFQCRSLAGDKKREDVSALFGAVAAHGARLACRAGLKLVDWRGAACREFNQSDLLDDGMHWRPHAYDRFAALTATEPATGCYLSMPPQPTNLECECAKCRSHVAFTWSLGNPSTSLACAGRKPPSGR